MRFSFVTISLCILILLTSNASPSSFCYSQTIELQGVQPFWKVDESLYHCYKSSKEIIGRQQKAFCPALRLADISTDDCDSM